MTTDPTVYIVDDDTWARESAAAVLQSLGLSVQCFESAETFLSAEIGSSRSCLICGLRLPGMDGMELLRSMTESQNTTPVILASAHADVRTTVQALKLGAVTVLAKPYQDRELAEAIQAAMKQNESSETRARELDDLNRRFEQLSDKEMDVLHFMVEGVANKVMARRMEVSMRTIEKRRHKIFEKTGTESLAELVRFYCRRRYLQQEQKEHQITL